jgi:hypothetical protein
MNENLKLNLIDFSKLCKKKITQSDTNSNNSDQLNIKLAGIENINRSNLETVLLKSELIINSADLIKDQSIFQDENINKNNFLQYFSMFEEDSFNFSSFLLRLKNNLYSLLTNNYDIDFKGTENFEALIIYYILQRKMKMKIDIKSSKEFGYLEYKNSISDFKSKDFNKNCQKRAEEDFKFVYKLFKKVKKNVFFQKRQKNKDILFVDYYFGELSKISNLDIKYFFDPSNNNYVQKNNKKLRNEKRSLNFKFLKLIIKSDKFYRDFVFFLEKEVKEIYPKLLMNKIETFLKSLETHIEYNLRINNLEDDRTVWEKGIYTYIIKKKQCKIPWTINEVEKGVANILNRIHLFRNS